MMFLTLWSVFSCTQVQKDTEEGNEITSDQDGDGVSEADGDCNDDDATIYPDAEDSWYDGVDSDCAGNDDFDQDGDGFAASGYEGSSLLGGDCWDDPSEMPEAFVVLSGFEQPAAEMVNPDASEVYYDGIDGDCANPEFEFDQDQDGENSKYHVNRAGITGNDCVDNTDDAEEYEVEGLEPSEINSQMSETYYDGIDQNCDGLSDFDADQDGDDSDEHGGSDCDDSDQSVHGSAEEEPIDGIDQDCNGLELCYTDADDDGFGVNILVETSDMGCWSLGIADNILDCQDGDADIYPGATEVLDNIDENCDGMEAAGHHACAGDSFYNDSWDYVYFLVCQEVVPQSQAESTCQDYGYELASIYDESETNEIASYYSSFLDAWIALTDQAQEGVFTWTDGSSPVYTNWNGGSVPTSNTNENCVSINGDGVWYNQDCSIGRYFACESRE